MLIHRRQLLDQWRERLATFLNLPIKSIGQIGGGRRRPSGIIDVAVIQSLKREVIVYDYVDGCVPVLSAMYSKRVRGYEAVGYSIQDE